MIDLRILEQFVTFYHTGTLSDTAEKMHISQSTLTRNMQKLEADFGVSLFSRTRNSIALNANGLMAAEEAELLLRQADALLLHVRNFDYRNRTILLGVCTPIFTSDLIRRLNNLYPEAAISAETKSISHLTEGLQKGDYQLILLPFCPKEEAFFAAKLCEEHLSFLLPKTHRFARRDSLSVSEMNGENILLFQDIGFWHDLVVEKMPDSRFLLQSERYSFLELTENSVLPVFTTNFAPLPTQDSNRVAIPITDPEFHVTYYLVCRKENRAKYSSLFSGIASQPIRSNLADSLSS